MIKVAFQLITLLSSLIATVFAYGGAFCMAEQLLLVNPRKRRSRSRRRAPARSRRRRSYRRNPIKLSAGSIFNTFKAGAVGAAGAVGVDFLMQRLPLPATLMTSRLQPAVRGLVGVALGWAVSRFLKQRKLGEELATGSVAVSLYGVAKNYMMPPPVVPVDENGQQVSGYGDLLGYGDDGLLGMGYFNPASTSSDPFSESLNYQPTPNMDSGGDFF